MGEVGDRKKGGEVLTLTLTNPNWKALVGDVGDRKKGGMPQTLRGSFDKGDH